MPSIVPPPARTPAGSPSLDGFGVSTPLFTDSFDDALSGWGTGSTAGGDVEYVDSALQFETVAAGNWVWSYRPLDSTQDVLHVEAAFTPSAAGYQGPLCARSAELLYGAVTSGDGRWVVVSLTPVGSEVLSTDEDAAWTIPIAVPTRMALDCAGSSTGAFRMQLSLPEAGLSAIHEGGTDGPDAFDRVGIFAEASAASYTLRVDDFAAFGGTGTAP
jgi:hypothetical protein